VQGDTTTTFCAALAAFYHQIPVGHIEAGLRTWNTSSPFPEEMNRVLITRLARWHFAPTQRAEENLLREGVPSDRIHVTGNTAIDALRIATEHIRCQAPLIPGLPPELMNSQSDKPLVLVTCHRRESYGEPLESICQGIRRAAEMFAHAAFVYPVHLNPNVRRSVQKILGSQKNIHLLDPLNYLQFVRLMHRATLILTDSGGIQEEAPTLGKPVLVLRDTTERPEAVEAGTAKLVGTASETIVENVSKLLTCAQTCTAMARKVNPYGDGHACERIVKIIEEIA
jgi:UDP-N-acetylglucosamine 2-epimerase (non-hydrolysing)